MVLNFYYRAQIVLTTAYANFACNCYSLRAWHNQHSTFACLLCAKRYTCELQNCNGQSWHLNLYPFFVKSSFWPWRQRASPSLMVSKVKYNWNNSIFKLLKSGNPGWIGARFILQPCLSRESFWIVQANMATKCRPFLCATVVLSITLSICQAAIVPVKDDGK